MKKKKGKRSGPGRKMAARRDGQMVSIANLQQAKKLAEKLGGVDQAQAALAALSKLAD